MKTKSILYAMLATFILIVLYFASPFEFTEKREFFLLLAALGLLFLILGIILLVQSRKTKGKLKIFLIMTGVSALTPLLFSVLHNFFYALAIAFENLAFIFEPLHAISFIISIIIGPIFFIVGMIGSFILLKRKQ